MQTAPASKATRRAPRCTATATTSSTRSTRTSRSIEFVQEQIAGDEIVDGRSRGADRDRLHGALSRQSQLARLDPAQVPDRHRHHGHRRRGVPRPDGAVRALPRPQVRSDLAEGVLPSCKRSSRTSRKSPTSRCSTSAPVEEQYRAAQAKYDEATKDLHAQQQALLEPVRAETIKYQKERYLIDSQQSLFKPQNEWTAFDRWINHRWDNVTGRGTGVYEIDRYLRETAQLDVRGDGQGRHRRSSRSSRSCASSTTSSGSSTTCGRARAPTPSTS